MRKRNTISILVADDHTLFLDLFCSFLANDPSLVISGKASSGIHVVEMAYRLKPDVILMDIQMTPIDGFEATRQIRKKSPGSKVIGLSFSEITAFAKKMKSIGGMGYLTKCCSVDEVKHAITTVSKGNFYYCDLIRKNIEKEEKNEHLDGGENHLTERELKIIELIKEGRNTKNIAAHLGISHNTVHNHRQNIYKKLQVSNAASLMHKTHMLGL